MVGVKNMNVDTANPYAVNLRKQSFFVLKASAVFCKRNISKKYKGEME